MRHSIVLSLLFVHLLPFSIHAQQAGGYEITGHIQGLQEGEKVSMQLNYGSGWKDFITRDSAYVKDGVFHLKGFVPDGPRLYYMTFDRCGKYYRCLLIDNNEKITIRSLCSLDTLTHGIVNDWLIVEGSQSNATQIKFDYPYVQYYQSIYGLNAYLEKIKDSIGFNGTLIDGVQASKECIDNAFYWNFWRNPNSLIWYKPALLRYANEYFEDSRHSFYLKAIYEGLDERGKNSFFGKQLRELTPLCVGQLLPEFTLPTSNGKLFSLKEMVSKSRVTIIHFWATKSVNRNEYDAELRVMYRKYHDKGLNIIGVSTDSYMDQFKETVQTEQYPWQNVVDLKGKMIVDTTYHELGAVDHQNTTNVLLDDHGKIIAWDTTGILLQWYLWKYLENRIDAKAQASGE